MQAMFGKRTGPADRRSGAMTFGPVARRAFAAAVVLLAGGLVARADDFRGTWQVKDSKGKPFQISLQPGGEAIGTQHPGMHGRWKQEGSNVVIFWTTGWTTKIHKKDDHYTHSAWAPNADGGPPTNQSDARKLK